MLRHSCNHDYHKTASATPHRLIQYPLLLLQAPSSPSGRERLSRRAEYAQGIARDSCNFSRVMERSIYLAPSEAPAGSGLSCGELINFFYYSELQYTIPSLHESQVAVLAMVVSLPASRT